ncbi:hypothetical protein ABPG75_005923 [Micractinium tetrahymenae]
MSMATALLPAATGSATSQRALCASSRRPFTALRPQRRRWQHLARAEGEGSSEQATQQQPAAPAEQQGAPQPPAAAQRPAAEEEPIWVRRERERAAQKEAGGSGDLPFGAYLLFSSFVAIAAVGSIFEYINQHAVFDVIQPDSPLYAPVLGFFAVTGLPTAGFLFYKAVRAANAEAERMDKLDGY